MVAPNYRQRPAMDGPDYPNYIVTSSSDSEEIPNAEESDDEIEVGTNPQHQVELLQDIMDSPAHEEELNSQQPFQQQESTPIQWHSDEIPYLDHLQDRPDAFVFTRDDDHIRRSLWKEPVDLLKQKAHIEKGMIFSSKKSMQRTVKIYCIQGMREFKVDDST